MHIILPKNLWFLPPFMRLFTGHVSQAKQYWDNVQSNADPDELWGRLVGSERQNRYGGDENWSKNKTAILSLMEGIRPGALNVLCMPQLCIKHNIQRRSMWHFKIHKMDAQTEHSFLQNGVISTCLLTSSIKSSFSPSDTHSLQSAWMKINHVSFNAYRGLIEIPAHQNVNGRSETLFALTCWECQAITKQH